MMLLPAFTHAPESNRVYNVEATTLLKAMPDESVNCIVTSPPYFGLRDYGVPGQIGLEKTPAEYVARLVGLFQEARRVLRDDGTFWLNLGDSYASKPVGTFNGGSKLLAGRDLSGHVTSGGIDKTAFGIPEKNLLGIPWRVAFGLQDDGWILRSDIIWCLSGGSYVYARTQKGDMPMMVRDMARLKPETVKLWNGEKWTQVLGWSRSARQGTEVEIVLRSGERISCTPTHQFPTNRGLLRAEELVAGDVLKRVCLPESDDLLNPEHVGLDAAWFAGLYVAEGSRSDDTIQIAGHVKEQARWRRVKRIAESYGGSATRTIDGNNMNIRVYGKMLLAILDMLVSGHTAKDKCFNPVVWRYSNEFLYELLQGYLSGDGHYDEENDRWRLGFTRNYNLERDLRTLAARLGFRLVLKMTHVQYNGGTQPTFRGEIRFNQSGHWNCKDVNEIVEIRKARCREVYDIGVADEPHVFALASGVLTHNSKPNPMPESVTDRPTKAHEYIFLFAKSARYWYDADAIAETAVNGDPTQPRGSEGVLGSVNGGRRLDSRAGKGRFEYSGKYNGDTNGEQRAFVVIKEKRNKRSVWTVANTPMKLRDDLTPEKRAYVVSELLRRGLL